MNQTLDTALEYLEKYACSVIPIKPRDKKPLLPWEEFQKRRATRQEVEGWFRKHPLANIGIITGAISGRVVIDIDSLEGEENINKLLPDSILIPTCITPRGFKHLYFQNTKEPISNNTRTIPGADFRGEGGYVVAPPSIGSNGKPYHWQDGLSMEVKAPALPERYRRVLAEAGALAHARAYKNIKIGGCGGGNWDGIERCKESVRNAPEMFTDGRRDNDLFHTANMLVKGGMPEQEIFQVLRNLIISWGEIPDEKWILDKISSALNRSDRRERTLSEDVLSYINLTTGYFSLTETYSALQVLTPRDKNNVHQIMHRLAKDGLVQRFGDKNGVYRRVDGDCEEIDWKNASSEFLKIAWPFGIEKLANTMPKNIIVVAGGPDAGKTAFLLNFVKMNQNQHEIFYYSSEMGGTEMQERMKKFGLPFDYWKFTLKERSGNFADVIKPNAVNIIDFLELHKDFFLIGQMIKDIFDKLEKGIAIIAVQKNPGLEVGLGGFRGMEKARLYLTMDSGLLRIQKAKNWVDGRKNPNRLERKYKIINGCEFIEVGTWMQGQGQESRKVKK